MVWFVAEMIELETNVAKKRTVSPEVEDALVVICVEAIDAARDLLYSPGRIEALEAKADCKLPSIM